MTLADFAFATNERPATRGQSAVHEVAGRYAARVYRTLDEIETLEADWRHLESVAEGAIVFQTYDLCRLAIEHAAGQNSEGAIAPFVCAVFDGQDLVGLLPLMIAQKRFRSVLTGLAEPFQQYTEMLAAPGHDPAALFAAMRPQMAASGADYVHFGQVRASGNLSSATQNTMRNSGEYEGAPFVPLANWPDFETYFKTIKPKTRKNMRNARNHLSEMGELAHQVHMDGPEHDAVIARTYAGRADWLARMGVASRAFNDVGFEQFLDRLKSGGNSGIKTISMSLTLSGHPIAEQWGFLHAGCYYAFISSWDKNFEAQSPGKLHLGEVLSACYDLGLQEADFMIPIVPYKLTWAPRHVPVQDRVMPLSLRGRLYCGLWLDLLRPLAKKVAYALPRDIRKKIFGLVLHSEPASAS